jgi:hypothetical protein
MDATSKAKEWHTKEQERIAKQGFRKENGGQLVGVVTGWGRKKRRINRKPWLKGNLVTEIARTVTG